MRGFRCCALVLLLLAGSLAAGCLGDDWPTEECKENGSLYVETVSPPGYNSLPLSGEVLQVELGDEATFQANTGKCAFAEYEWVIESGHPAGVSGSTSTERQVSMNDTLTVEFDRMGWYAVGVVLRDDQGRDATDGWGFLGMGVYVDYSTSDLLPTDGSTWSTSFRAMCCPEKGATMMYLNEERMEGTGWTERFIVERTGRVLYEGKPGGWDVDDFLQLSHNWTEVIRMEMEPGSWILPPDLRHEYGIEFRIGQSYAGRDDGGAWS